jgi:hypothetical protein
MAACSKLTRERDHAGMTEVALAFSNIDKPRADALARILNAVGYEVASQPLTPEKVDRASAVLAFWSPSSINSQPVQTFASQAAYAKKLVSVRSGPADPPAAFALVTLHDLSSWTGSIDAPELRTLVSHVAKMAPPTQQQQQQAQQRGGVGFAGNGFDPYAPQAPAPAPRPAPREASEPAVARAPVADRAARTAPASTGSRAARVERDSAPEPRRAAGGGVARMAFGAIAVTVLGGAAVAAFNYEGDDKTAAADGETGSSILAAAPAPVAAPPAVEAAPSQIADPATTEPAPVEVAANTYAEPAATAPAAPQGGPVTVQAPNGWTSTLPATPPVRATAPAAQRVAATTGATPARATQPARLPPIGGARPQATDLVAIDGGANLGGDNDVAPPPGAQPAQQRVWQKEGVTYGPDN